MNKNQILLISGGFVVVTVLTYVFFAYHHKLFPFGKSTDEGNNAHGGTDTIGNLKIVDFKNMLKTGLDISNDEIISEFTLILSTLFNMNDTEIVKKIKFPIDKNDSHVLSISDAGQKSIFNFINKIKSELTEDATKGSEFLKRLQCDFISNVLKQCCNMNKSSIKLNYSVYGNLIYMKNFFKNIISLISEAMKMEDRVFTANDAVKNATTKKYKFTIEKASTAIFPTSTESSITLSLLEIVFYTIFVTVSDDRFISELGKSSILK